ncbi:MAG: hypothetical protein KGZ65_06120 [Sphingomonadales bacterium]|nr:hypothetical protein [Sphingomonadaceae bacterium]MBS3930795.1 hypothetical protein [Sphingomonadales bacterium]
MIEKRVTQNEFGEPVLTIKIVGVTDVYRFARLMEHGQVEFCHKGRLTLRSLAKQIGRKNFKELVGSLERGFTEPDWSKRYFDEDAATEGKDA